MKTALKDLFGWKNTAEKPSACGAACGAAAKAFDFAHKKDAVSSQDDGSANGKIVVKC